MVQSTGCSLRASGFDSHRLCYLHSLHNIRGETKLSSGTHFLFFCIVLWWKETLTLLIFALRIYQREQIGYLLRLLGFYYSNKFMLNKNSLMITIGRTDKFLKQGFMYFGKFIKFLHSALTLPFSEPGYCWNFWNTKGPTSCTPLCLSSFCSKIKVCVYACIGALYFKILCANLIINFPLKNIFVSSLLLFCVKRIYTLYSSLLWN